MVGQQGPSVDRPGFGFGQGGQASHEVGPVPIIPEDGGPLNPPHHDVVEGLRRVEPRLTWHGKREDSTSRQRMQRPHLHLLGSLLERQGESESNGRRPGLLEPRSYCSQTDGSKS